MCTASQRNCPVQQGASSKLCATGLHFPSPLPSPLLLIDFVSLIFTFAFSEVQDEVHGVFRCIFPPLVTLRRNFPQLFETVLPDSDDLHTFMNQSNVSAVASFISRLISLCEAA